MPGLKRLISLALLAAFTPLLVFSVQAQNAETSAKGTPAKRPMTFEDMMAMKRLGETAVSPDGKWLAYSVTTVDLAKNSKSSEWWLQAIAPSSGSGGEPFKIAVTQPGDNGIQFAPDGRAVVFLSSREGGQQIWRADFDPATGATANAKKLSAISTEASDAIVSPDSRSMLFTSAVYPDCPAISTADFATGDKCNADRDAAAAASKVKAQIFTHLLYKHWDHFTGAKRSHLFLLDGTNGKVRDLTPNDPRDVPPFSLEGGCGCAFAPDSREIAFTENLDEEPAISTSASIFTLDLTNAAAKPVKVSTSKGGNFNPAYSPDGKYLAWRSEERAGYEADKFRLMIYDREKGSKSAGQQVNKSALRDLLPKFDNWVDEFVWSADSSQILFVSGVSGESPMFSVNIQSGQLYRFDVCLASEYQTTGDSSTCSNHGEYSGIHLSVNSANILATRMAVDQPGEVYQLSPDANWKGMSFSGEETNIASVWRDKEAPRFVLATPITHLNYALLNTLDLSSLSSFDFAAQDGVKLQGFLVSPPHFDCKKKYPVKFLIHGGPQGAWGDAWSYRWNAELFAANGYVVVMINPRGSTGYGQKIVDGVNGDWGGKPFSDLMLGLDAAERKFPFIDKERECALGASYGGYMANWVLGHTDRFKCIVSHDGMFNPESAYGTTEELWFNEWEFAGKPWDYYGKPDSENPFRKWSPAMSAKNFKTPTLVIHSQLDYRLDVGEGYQLFTTLQRMKVPSKMLYFPDENHWVLKPQNSQLWYKTVNDWVDQWTGKAGTRDQGLGNRE